MTTSSKSELLASVSVHAREFELAPLLRLLRSRLPEYAICYRGRASLACEPSLIDRIEVENRRIVIYLNLGLQSSTSPLASYFLRLRHDTRAGAALEQLLSLCDHALLGARAEATQPLATDHQLPLPHALRETFWQLHQPSSAQSLHWQFKRIFPELEVSVRRMPRTRNSPAAAARNGWATLGGTALKGEVSVTVSAYDVTLVADDAESPCAEPWHQEIKTRLGQLSVVHDPGKSLVLRVILIDRANAQCLTLQGAELGFASLGQARSPRLSWP
ncbi:MAG TPA: hypothetical protein VIV60_30085 [Polyangiaceae bacterium]